MMQRVTPPRPQKAAVLAAVALLHVALIALFLRDTVTVAPVVEQRTVAMFAINAERPAAAKPPPPALPATLADTFTPIEELSIPTDSVSDSPAGASGICATPVAIADALLLDAVALDALRSAPPETRSIADAVVIWNEGWISAASAPGAPLFAVRAAIERSLSEAADHCLDEAIAGPRFFPLPDAAGTRTIFLVVGSGNWTWRALLSAPAGSGTAGTAPAPSTLPDAL